MLAVSSVVVIMKNGERHDFPHEGRPGGSYTKSVAFESGWVIVTDEWGKRRAFPSDDVAEVKETTTRW